MDRHPNSIFYFNTDPDADPTPSFKHVGKSEKFTFSHSSASLHCFTLFTFALHLDEMDTDPPK